MHHFTLIIKPTKICNATCIYCSAWKEKPKNLFMSMETLELIYKRLSEYHSMVGLEGIMMTWHGGEPTLVSPSFYEKAMELQESYLRSFGVRVNNIMQSNLIALTEKKAELFSRLIRYDDGNPSSIGTSYDPIEGIRLAKTGSYEKRWKKAIDILKSYGINYGLVYVIHKYSLPKAKEIYNYFTDTMDGISVRFNPLYPEGRAGLPGSQDYYISPLEYGRFLLKLYELWVRDGKNSVYNPLKEWDDYHNGKAFSMCCEMSGKCSKNHIGIDTDGSISICGRGIDRGTFYHGNIHEKDLVALLNSNTRKKLHNRPVYLQMTSCRDCNWWNYCHGGCPVEADLSCKNFFKCTSWCEGRKYFFNNAFKVPRIENMRREMCVV